MGAFSRHLEPCVRQECLKLVNNLINFSYHYFSYVTRFQINKFYVSYLFDNSYGFTLAHINHHSHTITFTTHTLQIKMFSSSLSKVSVLHLYPLRNPHLHHLHTPALDCHEQEALIIAQEYEQLERLQADCDSHYVVSNAFGHKVIISATSLVKLFIDRSFRKHWQNHVRTWFNQPARKTRSLAVRQKMPVMLLPRTSDGSFKLNAEKVIWSLRLSSLRPAEESPSRRPFQR